MFAKKRIVFIPKKHISRWFVLAFDSIIVVVAILIAYLLRFNFSIPEEYVKSLALVVSYVVVIRMIGFVFGSTHLSIIRYTSTRDAEHLAVVLSIGSFIFLGINLLGNYFFDKPNLIPYSIIIIELFVSMVLIVAYRLVVRSFFQEAINPSKQKNNILIFGSDELALITKRTLDRDAESKLKVVGFIEVNPKKIGHRVENTSIYHYSKLQKIIEKHNVQQFIFTSKTLDYEIKNSITEICLEHNVEIKVVPDVQNWINGELSFKQIKPYKIEDLLERESITLDEKRIKADVLNKVVMVTGAAGSIGSEIVVQLTKFKPKLIILYDQAETPLYHIDIKLREKLGFVDFKTIVGDIGDEARLSYIIARYSPYIIYHAAALKHVPLMELNPAEAIHTNILGTRILANVAMKHGVDKFIMVSTDKAVNPTSVMGATKRVAEIYTQSLNTQGKTKFITTRFGNVLGSNGSVIPRFREQINAGGPITITHREITRYFMTIPEACQLVLEAGAMGEGGEVFMFDMGRSVKILDLAKKMIRLSGLELGKDIYITFTGLRPGEKLYEELLYKNENYLPTHNKKIMIAKVDEYGFDVINTQVKEFEQLRPKFDNYALVKKIKEIVPEYISNNSPYETLDA